MKNITYITLLSTFLFLVFNPIHSQETAKENFSDTSSEQTEAKVTDVKKR